MKKRMVSFFISLAICFSLINTSIFAYGGEVADNIFLLEPKSEYQMAIEATIKQAELQQDDSDENNKTPLDFFKEAFDERANLSPEILEDMGYTDDDICILQSYSNGLCTFEEAATRASAMISSYFSCPIHNSDEYVVRYTWEWNKMPVNIGEDVFTLAYVGIDDQSQALVSKVNDASAAVEYYYMSGTGSYCETEYCDVDGVDESVVAKFDMTKIDNLDAQWVWAKSGFITASISPAVSTGEFSAVQVNGAYGHAEGNVAIEVTVTYSPATGQIFCTIR